jgi:hypothetical protein
MHLPRAEAVGPQATQARYTPQALPHLWGSSLGWGMSVLLSFVASRETPDSGVFWKTTR